MPCTPLLLPRAAVPPASGPMLRLRKCARRRICQWCNFRCRAARMGPDAALAKVRRARDLPGGQLQMRGRRDQAITANFGPASLVPLHIDPYRGTIIPSAGPPPNKADNFQRMMGRLHEAIGLG